MEYMKVPYKSTDIFRMTSSLEKIVTVVSLLDSFFQKTLCGVYCAPFCAGLSVHCKERKYLTIRSTSGNIKEQVFMKQLG